MHAKQTGAMTSHAEQTGATTFMPDFSSFGSPSRASELCLFDLSRDLRNLCARNGKVQSARVRIIERLVCGHRVTSTVLHHIQKDPFRMKHDTCTRTPVQNERLNNNRKKALRPAVAEDEEIQVLLSTNIAFNKLLVNVISIYKMLECALLFFCGGIGPSTALLANQAPVYCGCPAGTHGCDLVSRVRLDQSANPVVCGWVSCHVL